MSANNGGIEGERAVSPTAGTRRGVTKWQKVAIFGLGTGAVVAAVFWRDGAHRSKTDTPTAPQQMSQIVPFERFIPPPVAPAAFVPPAPLPQPTLAQVFHENAQPPVTSKAPPPKRMLSYASVAPPHSEPAAAPAVAAAEQTGLTLKAGRIPGVKAGPAMDTTYMLMPGMVKCTLDNAINTMQPGPIFCHTSEDVFSPAHVKLMEAGTQIVGNYTSNVQQGQNRLPAVSAFAITPNGVPIAFSSPMGDALGRSGFAGDVDTHFTSRFGGALLLLASQGAISVAQAALQHGNGSSYINLNTGGVEGAVTETLRNSINIPPTVSVNQGSEIAFLVTVPISFADAYQLRSVP